VTVNRFACHIWLILAVSPVQGCAKVGLWVSSVRQYIQDGHTDQPMKIVVEKLLVCFMCVLNITSYSCPYTGLDRPLGFQEAEAPIFVDNRHVKVARLSVVLTGHLYPYEISLVLISVSYRIDPSGP